jgi:hypothetical protein
MFRDDPAPQQVPHVGRESVDLTLLPVQRQDVVASLLVPEVAVEALTELRGLVLEPCGERRIAPHFPGEPGRPVPRVVCIALKLAGCDRRLRDGSVREQNRIPRVLPTMVVETTRRPGAILEVAVAVRITRSLDPPQCGTSRRL